MRPSSGARLPGIEGLRAIAACSILVVHVWGFTPTEDGGRLGHVDRFMPDLRYGVVLFFTLSGFLLWNVPVHELAAGQPAPRQSVIVTALLPCATCRTVDRAELFSAYTPSP